MENNNSKGNNTNKLLLVLLLASLATNVWLFSSKSTMQEDYRQEKDSLITANIDIEKELNDTYTELNQYKGINGRLDSLLQEANGKIDEQKARIEAIIRKEGKTSKLNKQLLAELDELKKLRDQYLEKIDQLLVENEQLKKEKGELTATVENLSKDLEKTVNTASVLRAEYIRPAAYKKRSSGKYVATAMAKRTNKIEICFAVLENKIAKSGSKTAYMRLIEPGGKVLGNRSEGSSTFRRNDTGEDVLFTSSKTIEYNNDKVDNICMEWEEQDRLFTAGTYTVELFIDGNPAGSSTVVLR